MARGWRARRCPTCRAWAGDACQTPSGREASGPHTARLSPGRRELAARLAAWEELKRRGVTRAVVPFSGRAGAGGTTGAITLNLVVAGELVDVERWTGGDELALALEGPVWDRYGHPAGQPQIRGTVTWAVADRRIVIAGRRGGAAFEEVIA